MAMDPEFKPMHMSVTHADCVGNGEFGRFWILPGSMDRAKHIAETYLVGVDVRPSGRGHNAYLGTRTEADGTKVDIGVISTGMGAPSVDIIVTELIKVGAKVLVRVGTAGTMVERLQVGDLVIASGAVRDDGASQHYMPIEFPAMSDARVNVALACAAEEAMDEEPDWFYETGPVHTKSSLMAREFKCGPMVEQHEKYMTLLEDCGCIASEMECSMLFTLGQVHRVMTGGICGILGGKHCPIVDDPAAHAKVTTRSCKVVVRALGILHKNLEQSKVRARPSVKGGGASAA